MFRKYCLILELTFIFELMNIKKCFTSEYDRWTSMHFCHQFPSLFMPVFESKKFLTAVSASPLEWRVFCISVQILEKMVVSGWEIRRIWWKRIKSFWLVSWLGLALWHINHCRLFNAKSIFIHKQFYFKQFSLALIQFKCQTLLFNT